MISEAMTPDEALAALTKIPEMLDAAEAEMQAAVSTAVENLKKATEAITILATCMYHDADHVV